MAKKGVYNVLNTATGQYEEYDLKTSVAQVEGLPEKIAEFEGKAEEAESAISELSAQKADKTELDNKANKDDVYIKSESDSAVEQKVNDGLTYKYAGSVTIGNSLALPNVWHELVCITDNNQARPSLEFIIPYGYVEFNTKSVANGYYGNSGYYGYAYITCTKTTVTYSEHLHVGTTPTGSKMYVYYR